MARRTALFVTPGRGSYSRDTLGYLSRFHGRRRDLIAGFDKIRSAAGQETVSALDGAASFSAAKHMRGDNASALIYAASIADFLAIDPENFEVVGVTGNSMGWYTALGCAGAVSPAAGFEIANTMGRLMTEAMIGGQMVYPFVGDDWTAIPGRRDMLMGLADEIDGLYISIHLGGMIVFAGDDNALKAAEARLERVDERFPMRLANHAAFHSPLQTPVSQRGRELLANVGFGRPDLPLVDGRGHVWLARAGEAKDLANYTLGHQVTEPYDFSAAIRSSLREFAPDVIIASGPGNSLGSAIAQILIEMSWKGLKTKQDFVNLQASDPIILSLGIDAQRLVATGGAAPAS